MPECILRFPSTRSSPTRVLAYACFLRSGGYGLGKTSIATVSVAKEGMFSGTTLSLPHFCLDQCHFAPTSEPGCIHLSPLEIGSEQKKNKQKKQKKTKNNKKQKEEEYSRLISE